MYPTIKYVFITAWRDKMFWVLLAGILATSVVAHMLGATAEIDRQELTISYSSNAARVVIVIGLIIFVCSHLHNAFTTSEVDVFLSRPITRSTLVVSYWAGFAFVALLHVLAVIALMAVQGVGSWKGYLVWSFSLLFECWLVVAVALFASFTFKKNIASVLGSLGIYVLARMMGFFMVTSQTAFMFQKQWLNDIIVWVIKGISVVVPRLDFFAKDEWLTHGVGHAYDVKLFAVQAAIYIPLLIFATISDFKQRQF